MSLHPVPRFRVAPDAESLRRRAEALDRFARWEAGHPASLSPAAALAAVAFLYELVPAASRRRVVDASGVVEMHRLLAGLGRGGG